MVEAVERAVKQMREECERAGKDQRHSASAIRSSPHPSSTRQYTRAISAARFLTYIVGMPVFSKAWSKLNGWDAAEIQKLLDHQQFSSMAKPTADQSFHREEIMDPAAMVPEEWMRETCAKSAPSTSASPSCRSTATPESTNSPFTAARPPTTRG